MFYLSIISYFFLSILINQEERYVIWSADYKVVNDDFQKEVKPDLDKKSWQYYEDAVLKTGIFTIYQISDSQIDIVLIPVLDRKMSWKGNQLNAYTLQHEKLHFDLTELFARKIRQKIQSFQNKDVNDIDIYENMIDSLLNQYESYQIEYDHETMGGNIKEKQEEWNGRILKSLNKLCEFSTDNLQLTNDMKEELQNQNLN